MLAKAFEFNNGLRIFRSVESGGRVCDVIMDPLVYVGLFDEMFSGLDNLQLVYTLIGEKYVYMYIESKFGRFSIDWFVTLVLYIMLWV